MRALAILAIAAACHAQKFDVASIKLAEPAEEGRRGKGSVDVKPGNLTMRNVGLSAAIMWAYKISPYQISNPDLLGREIYEIVAKAPGPAKTDEMRIMMQTLLAERFQMASHRETKEMPAFALVEASGGHKLKMSGAGDGRGVVPITGAKAGLSGEHATLDQVAFFLSGTLGRPVLDKTGLNGRYDFELDLTSFVRPGPGASGEAPPEPITILQTALPKQLGLRLEARRMPVEMLVIDHIAKAPVEN